MKLSARSLSAGLAVALAVVACDDPFSAKATTETRADTVTVFAVNGTPVGAPSALNLLAGAAVQVDASFAFELAFDLDGSNNPVVYPVQKVANQLGSTNRVGLQRMTGSTFEQVTLAPASGYRYDSTMVVTPGLPLTVEVTDALTCTSLTSAGVYYAKVSVLSVDPATRSMRVATTVDPNCGFRSFLTGVPKD